MQKIFQKMAAVKQESTQTGFPKLLRLKKILKKISQQLRSSPG